MSSDGSLVADTVDKYITGALSLDEAAARLAPLPETAFRDDSLNFEKGFSQEWIGRMWALNDAVRSLRKRQPVTRAT